MLFSSTSLWSAPSALGPLPANMPYVVRLRFPAELCESIAENAKLSGIALMVHNGVLWAVDLEDSAIHPLTFGDLEDPNSEVRELLRKHATIRRKPQLGTHPEVYYIV